MLIVRRGSSRVSKIRFVISPFAAIVKFLNFRIPELSYFHVVEFPDHRASALNNFAMSEPPGFETFQSRDVRVSRFLDLLIFK